MKTELHHCRLLPSKRLFAFLLAAALLITGTFAGCSKKSDQKTKTNDENTKSEINEPTPMVTPTKSPNAVTDPTPEEDSNKVISPNTIHDPDENADSDSKNTSEDASASNADSDSDADGNSNPSSDSKPTPTPTPKPVVDPETAPELEQEAPKLTGEMADDMIPLFDSMALAVSEYSADNFDPASPDYIWTSLYLAIVNYAEEGQNGISYSEDYLYKYAPASIVLGYASAMFSGMKELPPVPDSQNSHIVYLSDKDCYQFASSDRGASFTVITGIAAQEDGTYLVDTSMRTHSDEGVYVVHADYTFRVEPNTSSSSHTILGYSFAVTEIVKITTYDSFTRPAPTDALP